MPKKMFLVDGSNHAFRVHFALPPMHDATGFPTRVLYGFTTLFAKMLRVHQPDYVVVSFDKGTTFRHDIYPEYKGHRPEMPDDLAAQWPHLPDLVDGFGYLCVAVDGYEADDVLGTLAKRFASDDIEVSLVTGDTDFFQLVGPHVKVLDMMKEEEIGPAEVEAKMGVKPEQVIDVLALAGDTSDNIPGVPGVGEKTAVKYLQKYGSLENVLASADDVGGKRGQALKDHVDDVYLSRKLATICVDAPIELGLEDLHPKGMNEEKLRDLFDRWDFGKVARKLLPERPTVETDGYRIVTTDAELDALVDVLKEAGRFAIEVETSSKDIVQAQVIGLSFGWGPKDAAYVPLTPRVGVSLDPKAAWERLTPFLTEPEIEKTGHDLKWALAVLRRAGVPLDGIDGDVMLLDYVLAAHERSHGLADLANRYLGHTMVKPPSDSELPLGRNFAEAARFAPEGAHVAWLLEQKLLPRMDEGSVHVYRTIELPLLRVLADMELAGIRVDVGHVDEIRHDLEARLVEAERQCHELAKRPFNVNSRHDVAKVLFEELGFTPGKKVKDGYSTDSSVLEKIAEDDNLPARILEYRQLQKLLGTYLDKLPEYVRADGRIHTSFNQAVAATGRLSSADPNLQNIPIRTFEGRRIRECFVPAEGCVFVSADYSQIELRILAHLTEEEALVRSFTKGEDIHRRTASEVFGVAIDQVTFEQRNAAKAINFGLMYGMSAFRLSNDLQITKEEAQKYMDEYFGRLPKVRAWLDGTRAQARKTSQVTTMFGRRRVLPTMHAANYAERMAAEREAVNSGVQGAAADIIKIAMLRVTDVLVAKGYAAKLLLQVHDELLLEVPEAEVDAVSRDLVVAMEGAAKLAVPLHVNVATGKNWNEAHG